MVKGAEISTLMSQSNSQRISCFSWIVLKRQLVVLVVSTGLLGIVISVLYVQNRRHERELREQQGQHRVDVAHEFLSREINGVRADLLYLAEQNLLKRFLSGDQATREELEGEYVRFARRKGVYDQIRCLNPAGQEIIRVNFRDGRTTVVPVSQLQHKEDRYYFQQSLKLSPGEVFVSDFDLNVEHGVIERPLRPMIRFSTPVFNDEGMIQAILVLNYFGEPLLQRLNRVALPGSTLVVNTRGDYLLGQDLEDAWGWMLGHNRNFRSQFPFAWNGVLEQPDQTFSTPNGLFSSRRFHPLESRPSAQHPADSIHPDKVSLILVSYLPAREIFADSNKLLRQLLLMALGGMILLTILSGNWAVGAAVREEQARQIADSELRLRTLSTQLFSAQEFERRSISREIHDELGQQVTAISLDLQLAEKQVQSEPLSSLLKRSIEGTRQLLEDLHDFATRVRPAVLDDLGLKDAVESYLEEFHKRTRIPVESRLTFDAQAVPPVIAENVYRILQESLTNAAKHANPASVQVWIEETQNGLCLTVEDTGIGFGQEHSATNRLGLLGIRERVELLGGEFSLTSARGRGTSLKIQLPLPDKRDAAVS